MKIPENIKLSHRARKRVHKQLILMACIAVIPSIYLAYQTTQSSIKESHVNNYISECFNFPNTEVIQSNINDDTNTIEVALLGATIDNNTIKLLQSKLSEYHLDDMSLKVTQTETSSDADTEKLKEIIQSLINNNVDIASFKEFMNKTNINEPENPTDSIDFNKISQTIQSLYYNVDSCYMGYVERYSNDNLSTDTIMVVLETSSKLSQEDYTKIENLLYIQLDTDNFILLENSLAIETTTKTISEETLETSALEDTTTIESETLELVS